MSDPTGYKTRKTNTSKKTSSSIKRALSAPIPDDRNLSYKGVIDEPPVIAYGKYNDTNVIVFGEIYHNVDNRFYENLDLRDKYVFVEHPTTLCDITKTHTELFFNILKGVEWVWYKYSSRKKPIVCLDNRLELGLPSGIEEKFALQSSNADEVFPIILRAVDILKKKEIKIHFVRALLTPIYNTAIHAIQEQSADLKKPFDKPEQENKIDKNLMEIKRKSEQKVEFDENLMDLKWILVQNIMKLSGMLVDINTINHIKEYSEKQKDASKKKDIFIFMGAAHAYRLHKFFPEIFSNIVYNTSDPDLLESIQTITYE